MSACENLVKQQTLEKQLRKESMEHPALVRVKNKLSQHEDDVNDGNIHCHSRMHHRHNRS